MELLNCAWPGQALLCLLAVPPQGGLAGHWDKKWDSHCLCLLLVPSSSGSLWPHPGCEGEFGSRCCSLGAKELLN